MKNTTFKEFILAAAIRAVKTIAQTMLGLITVGATISSIDWLTALSISLVAGLYSVLTSIVTGLPETGTDGKLLIDVTSNEDREIYRLDLNPEFFETAAKKKTIRLEVDPSAILTDEVG